jgi:hypothetical protein
MKSRPILEPETVTPLSTNEYKYKGRGGALMTRKGWMVCGVVVVTVSALAALPTDTYALSTLSASGATAADIQASVGAFRTGLGDPNNANAPGPLDMGRREINWDGGGPPVINGTAPVTPFTVFENTRGGTFTTPGIGLTQAAATGGLRSLDLINPTYDELFAPFSLNRLFTPLGSNITEGTFSIPGTNGTEPAGVSGFGVVFSDVDLADETTIEFFNLAGDSLGVFSVPPATGNQTFSFLGGLVDPGDGLISRVLITTGTDPLVPNETPTTDLVVMDDFLYGEPQQIIVQEVPQPRSVLLLGMGLIAASALGWAARSRSRN